MERETSGRQPGGDTVTRDNLMAPAEHPRRTPPPDARTRPRALATLLAAAVILGLSAPAPLRAAQAQQPAPAADSVLDGVFTAAQAGRGEATFRAALRQLPRDRRVLRRPLSPELGGPHGGRAVRHDLYAHAGGQSGQPQPGRVRRRRRLSPAPERLRGGRDGAARRPERAAGRGYRRSGRQRRHRTRGRAAARLGADSPGTGCSPPATATG